MDSVLNSTYIYQEMKCHFSFETTRPLDLLVFHCAQRAVPPQMATPRRLSQRHSLKEVRLGAVRLRKVRASMTRGRGPLRSVAPVVRPHGLAHSEIAQSNIAHNETTHNGTVQRYDGTYQAGWPRQQEGTQGI